VSHQILREAGAPHGYEEFLDLWCEVSDEFDSKSSANLQEHSMEALGNAFLTRALGSTPAAHVTSRFVDAYLAEWSKGVVYLRGLREFLIRLSGQYRLGLISNTSDSQHVREHLGQLGVTDLFDVTVTSLEYGLRKPHPGIFQHAMDLMGSRPEESAYVGDSFEADYRGSSAAGMRAFLIDSDRRDDVPETARLASLFDLEERLRPLDQV
jgi:HAD superfamily hydrolase (TIGR01549 family)